MTQKQFFRNAFRIVLFLTAAVSLSVLRPAEASAANMAARIKASFFAQPPIGEDGWTQEQWDQNAYNFNTVLLRHAKLKKTNTMSAKLWFPKSLFKEQNDEIGVQFNLMAMDPDNSEGYWIKGRYWYFLRVEGRKGSNVPVLRIYDEPAGKDYIKIGKKASLKSSGNYYVLTINDGPMTGEIRNMEDWKEIKSTKLNTKKNYIMRTTVCVWGNIRRKASSYLYLDEVSLKSASTQKVTFDKQDYWQFNASTYQKDLKMKRVKIG